MNEKRTVRISRFLSRHLRHAPEELGLELAAGGWVEVNALLSACTRQGLVLTREELEHVVKSSDKQRFAFDETGKRIRANQGHSVEVDLQLEPAVPPEVLYHGTGAGAVEAVLREGLLKMSRHHVHLSGDVDTARRVGTRHGKPVIFVVDTVAMVRDGHVFYRSTNGVWLVDQVPPGYLRTL